MNPNTETPAQRTPYNADHVTIVDEGHTVTALYIPDPEQANNPRHVLADLTNQKYANVERVATAKRFHKKDGAAFSGWIVNSGPTNHSDPIPTKPQAMESLHHHIRDYFQRPSPPNGTQSPTMPAPAPAPTGPLPLPADAAPCPGFSDMTSPQWGRTLLAYYTAGTENEPAPHPPRWQPADDETAATLTGHLITDTLTYIHHYAGGTQGVTRAMGEAAAITDPDEELNHAVYQVLPTSIRLTQLKDRQTHQTHMLEHIATHLTITLPHHHPTSPPPPPATTAQDTRKHPARLARGLRMLGYYVASADDYDTYQDPDGWQRFNHHAAPYAGQLIAAALDYLNDTTGAPGVRRALERAAETADTDKDLSKALHQALPGARLTQLETHQTRQAHLIAQIAARLNIPSLTDHE